LSAARCEDCAILDDWHVVTDCATLRRQRRITTPLLGQTLSVAIDSSGDPHARSGPRRLPTALRYGLVWTSLGTPERDIPRFPECEESDRHVVIGGAVGVATSGLRAVENFLDMAHFPFVHTGYLGAEPMTEVRPYRVAVTAEDELLIDDCRFFQPVASPTAGNGIEVDYVYKVLRPFTVVLYKTNPVEPRRTDFIALMLQPVSEERCIAHSLLAYLKHGLDAATVRWFMQLIFGQDKPILENQVPKRLPLDPRAEIPTRADAVSVAYRRWLAARGVRYGAIPAAALSAVAGSPA
jgi:phenylpropionate dioxygenase-like ring-hydroxylating dioxygenase large terminal subunit